jgi:hypothetical protein
MAGNPNPYTPGAGHAPPHLAGREAEQEEFRKLLEQERILENVVLTGLRGVGKTVLLDERFKHAAVGAGWLWAGTDLSETSSLTEENLAVRLITDLSIAASSVTIERESGLGFGPPTTHTGALLSYEDLVKVYATAPGLISDKLKAVLLYAWNMLSQRDTRRVVFAYDEAQNLADHAGKDEYPLSVLLEVFQSIQRQGIPFMLVLTGLPTLFPKLVEARTYAERMFHIITLGRLTDDESRDAVIEPLNRANSVTRFTEDSVGMIVKESAGYPYFIQFICREVFDIFVQQIAADGRASFVPFESIQRKLDGDFFAGRWANVSDRQREMLWLIAWLDTGEEFTIQEIVESSKRTQIKAFGPSQTNQMLSKLGEQGLIYKNRFGKYLFAVPLLGEFIRRSFEPSSGPEPPAGLSRGVPLA